jgi:hypothetical protein
MDIASALREIDAVIARLEGARAILTGPVALAPRKHRSLRKPEVKLPQLAAPVAEPPAVTVIPPKVRREYRRRHKTVAATPEPRSLSSSVPPAPVFVPRAGIPIASGELGAIDTAHDTESLEAVMRRNLLRVVA